MSFGERYQEILDKYYSAERMVELKQLRGRLCGRDVALFGAAWIGDFVYERLLSWGITPVCFIDNYASGCTPNGHGPILRPSEVRKKYPDCIIILTLDRAKDVVWTQLLEMGFQTEQMIRDTVNLITIMDPDTFAPHIDGYKWAYDFFEDQTSKELVLQRIACYLLGENVPKSDCPQYFEKDLFSFSAHEVFVDGGFFTGDTTEEFIRQTNGHYQKIYGFEPDEFVRKKMPDSLRNENIEIIPKGLSSGSGMVSFVSTGGHSQASGGTVVSPDELEGTENVISIPVTSIDEFFQDKPAELKPTFIKMDIEGSEKLALLGAEKTIRQYRPKLAICVYHKPEDIYELTRLIVSFDPKYKFNLRHYAHYWWETVLFAYE